MAHRDALRYLSGYHRGYDQPLAHTLTDQDIEELRAALIKAFPGMKRHTGENADHGLHSALATIFYTLSEGSPLTAMDENEAAFFRAVLTHYNNWRAKRPEPYEPVEVVQHANPAGDLVIAPVPEFKDPDYGHFMVAIAQRLGIKRNDHLLNMGFAPGPGGSVKPAKNSREFAIAMVARLLPALLIEGAQPDGSVRLTPELCARYKVEKVENPKDTPRIATEYALKLNQSLTLLGFKEAPFVVDKDSITLDAEHVSPIREAVAQYRQVYPHLNQIGRTACWLMDRDTPAKIVDAPELRQLYENLQFAASEYSPTGKMVSLETHMRSRGELIDAMALLRPDIAQAARDNMKEAGEDENARGVLPLTPKQVRDFATSMYTLYGSLQVGVDKALETLRAEREAHPVVTEQPKKHIIDADQEGVVRKRTPTGVMRVQYSTGQQSDKSEERFMLELDVIQSALDLCKAVVEGAKHPDGNKVKYLPSKGEAGEYWFLRDKGMAEYDKKALCTFLQDGQGIKTELERISADPKHPQEKHWLCIPHDLMATIQEEADFIKGLRDDVRKAFKEGDKEKAQTLKEELIAEISPRVMGEHVTRVAEQVRNQAEQVEGVNGSTLA